MSSAVRRPAREAVQGIYPLLPLQQGMLFHELLDPRAQPYFRQVSFRIEGDFNPSICAFAWNALMGRHELLRSVFDYENTSRLLQLVLKERVVEFGEDDLGRLDSEEQAARIAGYRAADRARGFDLRQDPLMRIKVFRFGRQRFEMVWSHPHILLDGWSGSILLSEFAAIYSARRAGRLPDLPALPPYQAYLDKLATRNSEASRRFWAEQLDGYETLASLPRLGKGRPGASYQSSECSVSLRPDQDARLNDLAARTGVTLSTIMQAIWGILLGRYNDTGDVVFGTVVSGRTVDVDGIERMIGAFINTIPVRVAVRSGESIAALADRLQHLAIDSLEHDHVPLAEIQAGSRLPTGLLDHLLVFENYPPGAGEDPALGFRVTAVDADERANYDFGVLVQPGPPLRIVFKYNGELFTGAQMDRLGGHFLTLIDGFTADPAVPVERLDILRPAERIQLAEFACGPRAEYPRDDTLASLWRAQAARTPENFAVISGARRITYRELDTLSDRLAAALRRQCAFAPQQSVGVLAGRGWRRIVALLAILKAGAVYLPLSPALPDGRIRHCLDDAACRIVLVDASGRNRLHIIRPGLAAGIEEMLSGDETAPDMGVPDPHGLAYMIYTSGSTGRPKGVLIEHRGFVNMITQQISGFGITAADRVLQFSSCSFDASLSEIFMALLSGACLVLADSDAMHDRGRLLAVMAEHRVTVAGFSPSFLAALERPELPGLRVLISAGEAVDPNDARHYARRLKFINAYGPSEASVCASFHEVAPDRAYPAGIPIGRPLGNTGMRILDHNGRPVPIGVPGEICLFGPGLARGYNNSPELTRKKFAADPVAGEERLYRTGDVGLLLEDGNVVYRGRCDGQVKLNGQRIETGEVESLLRGYPGIQQAAVVVTRRRGGAGRLMAYVVASTPPDQADLLRHLAAFLPPYMLPSAVVHLPALPRTVAGKLDRRALPVRDPEGKDDHAPPETAAEELVAGVFESVLGCSKVGRDDAFRSLGGDSLTAIRVVGRLRKQGFVLELRDLLTQQSVAAVAAALTPSHAEAGRRPASGDMGCETPLTPIQATFFAEHKRDRHHFNHAVLLRAAQRLDDAPLRATIAALWQTHDALRLRFRFGPHGITQNVAGPVPPIAPVACDLRASARPWPALIADATARHRGFDLETGPLLKAVWYRLPDADLLLLLAHHLVVDAASWRFLLEDVCAGYCQAGAGQCPQLPRTSSYLEWAQTLDDYSRSDAVAAQLPWWQTIDGAAVRPLATDFPVVPHHYGETSVVTAAVPLPERPLSDSTVQAMLLSGLSRALVAWDGPGTTRVLLSSHGRFPVPGATADVSRTVGWFTAEFPFLVTAAEGPAESLEVLRGRLEHAAARAVDYGVLRMRDGESAAPRPEIAVNYLGRTEAEPNPLFSVADGLDSASAGRLERPRLLEIDAVRQAGRLAVAVRYCDRIHRLASIERLVAELRRTLNAVIAGAAMTLPQTRL